MIPVLIDVETWLKLPATVPVHLLTTMYRNREAALTIHKSNNPGGFEHQAWNGSFLLIVRTGRIFTAHDATVRDGCDKDEYRRILGCSSI